MLGRHASQEDLDRWLGVTAAVPGWIGFAIGRTIWWDALDANLHQRASVGETCERITRTYLEFVRYYVKAREGGRPNP